MPGEEVAPVTHGGRRPNQTGRPPRAGGGRDHGLHVRLSEAERAELEDGLLECETCIGTGRIRDGETDESRKCLNCNGDGYSETLSDLLRAGGLALVRSRHSKET